MKLEPTIHVTLGERELTLSDALAEAVKMDGITHIAVRPGVAPHLPKIGEVLSAPAYEQLAAHAVSIHDMTVVVDVTTGAQEELYYLSNPRRRAQQELVAR